MLLGHYGIGLAAKKADRRIPIGMLFFAANLPDVLWCILLFAGIEKSEIIPGYTSWVPVKGVYAPFSHGIAGVAGLSVLFALLLLLTGFLLKTRFPDLRAAIILGLVCFSHILADILVHVREIPLATTHGIQFGYGLWNFPVLSNAIEFALLGTGLFLFCQVCGKNLRQTIPVFILCVLLSAYQLMNGLVPPPPGLSSQGLAIMVLAGIIIFVFLAEILERRFCAAR